jgi:diguanylate cyclase (GGDEF)-like protein/PAS domain S-box-containing protein
MLTNKSWLFGRLIIVALAYFAAGKLGLLIPYIGSHVSLIWLPTGISVAALMRWGYGCWPGIFAGALLVNFSVSGDLLLSASIAVGNTLAPTLTTGILKRFQFRNYLNRAHDVILMVLAAACGMLISATCGVLSLHYLGGLTQEQMPLAWFIWWMGDAVGVLLVLPFLLNVSKVELKRLWDQRTVYLLWCGIASVFEWSIFQYVSAASGQFMLLSFIVLPLVIWSAMRFGITGASLAVLGLSMIAVWATFSMHGPFYQMNTHQGIFALWVFMSTLALVALMITVQQSERLQSEIAMRHSEAQMRAVIDGALDAIVTIDETGHLVEFNPAAERIFGYTRAQVVGRPLAEVIIPPNFRAAHTAGHSRFTATGEKHIFDRRLELTAMRADGTEFPVELTITSLRDKGLPLVTGFIRDISERKQAEQEIRNLAFFDSLTGLPNRRLLVDRLQQAFATSARSRSYGAVLFIDLDNFKSLNDSRGHDIGDLLLIEVAQRLRQSVRAEDTVSRLGGDEFVVVLEELSVDLQQAITQAKAVSEKISEVINHPYLLQGTEHHSSCSIGIGFFCGNDMPIDELMKRSDTAMYQAKAAGRNTMRVFDPTMQAALQKRIELEAQLRVALQRDQLHLYFQVQVDADKRVFGAEILLRWDHPKYGLMLPTEFIPVAEDSGLIIPIGNWVLRHACAQIKAWQATSAKHIQLAVNVSARQFRHPDFVAEVTQTLRETGADPRLLKLELTESVVLDNIEDAVAKMNALRELGVQFSMDDFGTGYSSLAYLKLLPLSQVKIDQSFVRDIAIDPNDAAIVKTIIGMSHTLGLEVIAEGVEKDAQFKLLKDYGCRKFQGYLFSKPLVVEQVEKLFDHNKLSFVEDSSENNGLT